MAWHGLVFSRDYLVVYGSPASVLTLVHLHFVCLDESKGFFSFKETYEVHKSKKIIYIMI